MPAKQAQHGDVVVRGQVGEDREQADEVELARPDRQQLEARQLLPVWVVPLVVGVELVELEPGVRDVGSQPFDQRRSTSTPT